MDISIKEIVCTTIDENGRIVRKDRFENGFEKLDEFLSNFSEGDSFVMESKGFNVKLANPLKIKLIAESRMKNDDIDSEILAKLLRNDWIPESYVPKKEIREIRRVVRTRIDIRRTMTSYKNRIKIEMKRLHVDYGEDPFTIEGKAFLRSLKSQRIDSYLNVLSGLENEVRRIDRDLKKYEDIEDVDMDGFFYYDPERESHKRTDFHSNLAKRRESIEKAFRSLKTDLDVFPLREHNESTVKGMLFFFFLSMIIKSILLRAMGSSKLSRKYSIESMLIELEKLHMIEDQAGSLREIERTRKQKDILDALSSISWW